MKHWFSLCIILLLFVTAHESQAQSKTDNICYINNDRIYFQLDKRWPDARRKEISILFSLDSSLMKQAFDGKSPLIADSITWEVTRINEYLYELSKPLAKNESSYNEKDVFLIDDNWFILPFILSPEFESAERYGVNKFGKNTTITYTDGIARFFLPGYQKAEQVFLSGTFNNWSTMELPMKKTETGWEAFITIAPGKYFYKYIVDGRWIYDANNLLREDDQNGGFNSVFYSYNYVFALHGFTNAKKVFVTGSFNNWAEKKLRMSPVAGGWNLPVYLSEGTHAYKFIVDGEWMNDPLNKNVHADADGNLNSFIGIGDTLVFRLNGFKTADKVILSGSFNAWSTNELVMNKTADGWEIPYVLAAGNYEYKFIVDGQWMPDPANPVTTGSGDFVNSCIAFKPNYTFMLSQFADAKSVIVTGSFNGWREDSYQMIKKDGNWTYPVSLKPGKYTYKFIIDGQWMIDPANEVWEENSEGTGNSVLWIEP